jgi:acetylglutamate kinase
MTQAESEIYKQMGVIADGMLPKIDNSFRAMDKGVNEVIILHAKNLISKKGTILLNYRDGESKP